MIPDKDELAAWNFIKGLPRPTTVTLDRTIIADGNLDGSSESKNLLRKRYLVSPMDSAITAIREKYTTKESQLKISSSDLFRKLVIALLQEDEKPATDTFPAALPEITKLLNNLESQLLENAVFLKQDTVDAQSIHGYFKATRALTKATSSKTNTPIIRRRELVNRLIKVDRLISTFDEFNTKTKTIEAPIENYLLWINKFLKDSKKSAFFDDSDFTIYYKIDGGTKARPQPKRHLSLLSSGEKQIFILLTYLVAIASPNGIFVVDEPELSLHPRWQKNLIRAGDALRPAGCQVILATHSPEIASFSPEKCQILSTLE